MRFEWDSAKEKIHREKHGVSFEDAQDCLLQELIISKSSTKPTHRLRNVSLLLDPSGGGDGY